ncbi:hypothetical protein DND132_2479 [Pseudodesulfovibrio mercurii]|uniref:Abhydrolase domain-containing 18 n=1 Tax=Pseudodesulfovibrio mercurii TaxID=641491 RepID=F0JCK2_9BACT|nr:hypothetical protein [Pseudodesulfovibrio mercurii]EGB15682.1 hypothetical protein DND132_2479 [Pseudodesulfovibrio mercurii]
MSFLCKKFMQGFDRTYLSIKNKHKTCSLHLNPDPFDGRVYTIDEFYEGYKKYFDDPLGFYNDYAPEDGICLRDGRHHRDTSEAQAPFRYMVFDSPVPSPWEENNLVPFKWFTNPEKPSRTLLLFAPGWGRTSQSFEEVWCRKLQEMGVDCGLTTVPYHQARTPQGSFSGEYWISANLFFTIANFRLYTAELRLLFQYMKRRYDYVGFIGMSSGGFQTALAANCEPADFLFPMITGGNLADITWDGLITTYVRQDLEAKGVTREQLARVWSVTDECVLGRHCKARYIKQYISMYDEVVGTENQLAMWEAIGRPDRMMVPSAHYSVYFFGNRILRDIARMVAENVAGWSRSPGSAA